MKKKLRQAKWRYTVNSVFYVLFYLMGTLLIFGSLFYIGFTVYLSIYGTPTQGTALKYYPAIEGPDSAKIVEYEYQVGGRTYTKSEDTTEKYFREQPQHFTVKYQPSDPEGDVHISIRDNWDLGAALIFAGCGVLCMFLPSMSKRIDKKLETRGYTEPHAACICGKHPKEKMHIEWMERSRSIIVAGIFIVFLIVYVITSWQTNDFSLDNEEVKLIAVLFVVYVIPFLWHFIRRYPEHHSLLCTLRYAGFRAIH